MSACGIAAVMSEAGRRLSGDTITAAMAVMRERTNGLGGGFAGYGIYPDWADHYAFHLIYGSEAAKEETEAYLRQQFVVDHAEPVPTRRTDGISNEPLLWRYFLRAPAERLNGTLTEDDYVVRAVMHVNGHIADAFVGSSGKNMGIFKGVGYPEDIGRFFRIEEYDGYLWIAHGRFPTNTTGWWGGAHPFGLLDWAVVHNGEISSYGINRRYLANFGYHCAMHTDTEVITYLFDMLLRKHGLPVEEACIALAPPFWDDIERMEPARRELARALRITYAGALLNGPFSVVLAHSRGMIGFNDRIKLRPMYAARAGEDLFIASEEAAIREVSPALDSVWQAEGGQPIVCQLKARAEEPASA
jgi:glutamate synthase domain-containing protein 1